MIDPITLEVIRNRLDAIADEMEITLLKSSHSPIVKEALDASAALFDARGQQIAQATAAPIHLGMIIPAVERFLEVFPPETMREGDVFVLNDPFDGGTHLPRRRGCRACHRRRRRCAHSQWRSRTTRRWAAAIPGRRPWT